MRVCDPQLRVVRGADEAQAGARHTPDGEEGEGGLIRAQVNKILFITLLGRMYKYDVRLTH